MSRRTMTRRDCCTGSERVAGAFAGVEAQRPDLSDPEGKGDTRSEADSGRRPNALQLICASSPTPRCFEAERRVPLLLGSNWGQLAPPLPSFPIHQVLDLLPPVSDKETCARKHRTSSNKSLPAEGQ